MKIHSNTDNHVAGRKALAQQAEATVTRALGHLAKHVTRVEVHLSDENGKTTRCATTEEAMMTPSRQAR